MPLSPRLKVILVPMVPNPAKNPILAELLDTHNGNVEVKFTHTQGIGLLIRRLPVQVTLPNDVVCLGKALHPTCLGGECPYPYTVIHTFSQTHILADTVILTHSFSNIHIFTYILAHTHRSSYPVLPTHTHILTHTSSHPHTYPT